MPATPSSGIQMALQPNNPFGRRECPGSGRRSREALPVAELDFPQPTSPICRRQGSLGLASRFDRPTALHWQCNNPGRARRNAGAAYQRQPTRATAPTAPVAPGGTSTQAPLKDAEARREARLAAANQHQPKRRPQQAVGAELGLASRRVELNTAKASSKGAGGRQRVATPAQRPFGAADSQQLGLASRVASGGVQSKPSQQAGSRQRYGGSGAAENFPQMHQTAPASALAAQQYLPSKMRYGKTRCSRRNSRRRRAPAEAFRQQVAAAIEVREARAAAEAREAAAYSLKEQVAAAEARAAAAEALAAVNADASPEPSWLERLANGDFEPLGDVEVVLAVSSSAAKARSSTKSLNDAAEKRAWLKSLDVPMWGKATMSLSEAPLPPMSLPSPTNELLLSH